MSLINQMLRDLEQRSPTPPKPPVPEALHIRKVALPDKSSHRGSHWWLTIAFVGLALAGMQYYQPAILPSPLSTVTSPAQPVTPPLIPSMAEQTLPVIPTEAKLLIENTPSAKTSLIPPDSAPINNIPSPPKPLPVAKTPSKKPALKPQKSPPAAKIAAADHGLSADALYRQAASLPPGIQRKDLLQEALILNPKHLVARTMLLQTLQQTNASLELKQFLDESLELFPGHPGFTTALAHWQIKQKQADAAISTLESIDTRQHHDPQFLALKAAGYQQQHQYPQALPLYQELTRIQPDKAENWLGLGICADNLQQPGLALQAYQQALNKKTLQGDVVNYIKQRLNALTY